MKAKVPNFNHQPQNFHLWIFSLTACNGIMLIMYKFYDNWQFSNENKCSKATGYQKLCFRLSIPLKSHRKISIKFLSENHILATFTKLRDQLITHLRAPQNWSLHARFLVTFDLLTPTAIPSEAQGWTTAHMCMKFGHSGCKGRTSSYPWENKSEHRHADRHAHNTIQEAPLLLTNGPMPVHAMLSRAALWWMTVIYWPDFPTFTYPSPIWRPQWGRSPRAIGFIFSTEKLEWLGYNLVKVAWWSTLSYGHNTSTWQTHRQPRHHI